MFAHETNIGKIWLVPLIYNDFQAALFTMAFLTDFKKRKLFFEVGFSIRRNLLFNLYF